MTVLEGGLPDDLGTDVYAADASADLGARIEVHRVALRALANPA